tara:strand:+ start:270 stop:557 length:288 start_codon:yes stop_codon:yes gene_type:complete
LPSYYAGTPRTRLEAIATGRAIITTDAHGGRETVGHGVDGFLVPVCDVEALVTAMEKFLLRPEMDEQMGKQSCQIVIHKYDVCKVNTYMINEMAL